jgi:SAM-dependent methyltransferase
VTAVESFDPQAYWEQRLQRFDLSAVGYSRIGAPYNRWLYRVRAVVFRRLLAATGRDWRSARVLDVGSGTGFYVREWLRAGVAEVTGSDLTRVAVENLRRAFPGTSFVRLDLTAESPPPPPASFDAVSAFDVLFHVVDDDGYRRALANVSLLLRRGGLFLLSENLVHGPAVRLDHQVSRPLAEVEEMLDSAGFELLLRRPMFVLMNAPVDSRNPLLRISWKLREGVLVRWPSVGAVLGPALFPLELALVAGLRESPSTELLLCRKRG